MTLDRRDLILAALAIAGVLLALAALSGCTSRGYLGAIADLRAGVLAAERTTDPAARDALYTAIGRRVLALTDQIPDLPEPVQSPAEIAADPSEYCEADPPAPSYEAPPPAPPTPWEQFRSLADRLVFWGGIVGAIGGVLWLVAALAGWAGWTGWVWSLVGSPLVAPVARLAASLGSVSALIGAGLAWALAYWWALLAAGLLAAAVLALIHWRDLARGWGRVRGIWAAARDRIRRGRG